MSNPIAGLYQTAQRATAAGDLAGAQVALLEILDRDKSSIGAWLNLAAVRRQLQDFQGANAALREVLRLDARNFPALLMIATMLEREGQSKAAAAAYGAALANAPPDIYLDAPTLKTVTHARSVHGKYTRELDAFIHSQLGDVKKQLAPGQSRRLDAFIGTTLRTRKRYRQEPLEYLYPGLPAIEFYDRDEFPWLSEFESATEAIQGELRTILRED